ncbi:MAG TPA: hypothetical protein VEO54_13145 [Thermoanaerobaculia bacterium]|nr:hypothetical protein [Thermoanaerobaculia bacterium]
MNERGVRVAIGLALTAAAVRLVPLQWLHPLNWDEIELFRAADWIARGRVPFRDFWQHHAPLAWFVYAPFAALTESPGVDAIIALRWLQILVWIAAFWLINRYMTNAGLPRFARWSAMALALSSSMLMTSAIELRFDVMAAVFYLAGLVLWQRGTPRAMFAAGAMFCLTGLTNMRLGPMLVVTVLLLRVVQRGAADISPPRWKGNPRANWIFAGGIAALIPALLYFAATGSLRALYQSVVIENYLGDKYGPDLGPVFLHRMLIQFGVRLIGTDRLFEWAAVDAGGVLLMILGFTGMVAALLRWRRPDDLFVMLLLQSANLFVISGMKFIYNYHLQMVVLMALPLVAWIVERIPRRGIVHALLVVAWCVNAFAALFRGKELDLAYQDFVMREVHARTRPDEKVWGGIPWALRREPAYRFWFLPDMTRRLVQHGSAPPYRLEDIVRDPPAAVVMDQYALTWVSSVQRELAPYFIRHYMPVWRNLWVPAPNARLGSGQGIEWLVPRDGTYRLFASPALARHEWFRRPLGASSYDNDDAARLTLTLPPPAAHPELLWWIDGQPTTMNASVALREGQHVRAVNRGRETLGVILLPGDDRVLFRQPPPGATLEAASTRVTHIPKL